MVIAAFPIEEVSAATSEPPLATESITYDDANVVSYITGYVCKKVWRSFESSSYQNKQQFLKCLQGLISDKNSPSPFAD